PQYVSVLYDLLSFVGFSIYNCQLETTVVQYLKDYTDSLPIYIDSKTVYAISSNPSNLTQKRSIDISQLKNIQQSSNQLEQRIVYIYGNNDKSPHMIDALNHMQGVVKYQIFDENQLDEFVQSIETDTPTIVAILSSDRNDDNVFLALIALQKMYGDNPPCEIIVQIKDPNKQRNIEQFGIKSIIVSSKIVSFFAMQNMLTVGGYMFYETLLSNGGVFDLCIDNANMVLDMDRDIEWQSYVQFVHSVFQSTNHLILPLGLVKDGKNKYFCDGLDKVNRWILKSNDILIYIKYNNI
ncbi:MAG: hypothetical protein FWF58_02850, partial [Firmicutes bacterium]|nr:hypothetical protein [Bacillota bacterium]